MMQKILETAAIYLNFPQEFVDFNFCRFLNAFERSACGEVSQ